MRHWVGLWLLLPACGRWGYEGGDLTSGGGGGDGPAAQADAPPGLADGAPGDPDAPMVVTVDGPPGPDAPPLADAPICAGVTRLVGAGIMPAPTWTGSGYGVAWLSESPREVRFIRLDVDGNTLGTATPLAPYLTGFDSPREVASGWSGSSWLVAWDGAEVNAARVGSDGLEVGTETPIDPASNSYSPDVAWNGSAWMVAFVKYDGSGNWNIYSARLATDGTVQAVQRLNNNNEESFQPDLAWTGSQFGVAWADSKFVMSNSYDHVFFGFMGSAGASSGGATPISDGFNDGYGNTQWQSPSLSWNGTRFGLAWEDQRDGNQEIYFAVVDASMGDRIGGDVRLTDDAGSSDQPSLAWNGVEHGLVWADGGGLHLARLNPDGSRRVGDATLPGTTGAAWPTLLWNGSSWAVAYHQGGSVYLTILCP